MLCTSFQVPNFLSDFLQMFFPSVRVKSNNAQALNIGLWYVDSFFQVLSLRQVAINVCSNYIFRLDSRNFMFF